MGPSRRILPHVVPRCVCGWICVHVIYRLCFPPVYFVPRYWMLMRDKMQYKCQSRRFQRVTSKRLPRRRGRALHPPPFEQYPAYRGIQKNIQGEPLLLTLLTAHCALLGGAMPPIANCPTGKAPDSRRGMALSIGARVKTAHSFSLRVFFIRLSTASRYSLVVT
jgi:hypothetical protein